MVDSVLGRRGVHARGHSEASKVGVAIATSTTEVASCPPTSTPFSRHFTCWWTISCPRARAGVRPGSPTPSSSRWRSRRCSRSPQRPAISCAGALPARTPVPVSAQTARLQQAPARLAPRSPGCITHLACRCPSFCDNLRLLDTTPVPCGHRARPPSAASSPAMPATASARATAATSGASGSTCCARRDGMPIAFELAPANAPERDVAAEMLERVELDGYTVIADKGFAGEDSSAHGRPRRALPAPRPPRRTRRHGSLGRSANGSNRSSGPAKASSRSKPTAAAPSQGLAPASAALLALAAGLWHNHDRRPRPPLHRLRPLYGINHLGGIVAWWDQFSPLAGHRTNPPHQPPFQRPTRATRAAAPATPGQNSPSSRIRNAAATIPSTAARPAHRRG